MIRRNPFSSRFVRPRAMHFVAPEATLGTMAETVAAGGRWAIVGPHGTGKTTLVHHLRRLLDQRGRDSRLYALHDEGRRRRWDGSLGVTFIDGYEQLSAPARWRWRPSGFSARLFSP